jgi:hypothetical protein
MFSLAHAAGWCTLAGAGNTRSSRLPVSMPAGSVTWPFTPCRPTRQAPVSPSLAKDPGAGRRADSGRRAAVPRGRSCRGYFFCRRRRMRCDACRLNLSLSRKACGFRRQRRPARTEHIVEDICFVYAWSARYEGILPAVRPAVIASRGRGRLHDKRIALGLRLPTTGHVLPSGYRRPLTTHQAPPRVLSAHVRPWPQERQE